jgi:uncharacterized Zn finger protein
MKVYPAAHGRARLIWRGLVQYLQINGKLYLLAKAERSWQLASASGAIYNISLDQQDQPRCDCPDATYRDRPNCCKHLAALIAVGLIRKN